MRFCAAMKASSSGRLKALRGMEAEIDTSRHKGQTVAPLYIAFVVSKA
jgi:hypothetical protein